MSRRFLLNACLMSIIGFTTVLQSTFTAQNSASNHGSKPLLALLSGPQQPTRVLGGHNVTFQANPWQVALLAAARSSNRNAEFCGGSMVAPRWVLTAAHCVDQGTSPSQVEVLAGTASLQAGGTRIKIAPNGILVHEQWSPATHDFDVALIHVEADLTGSAVAAPSNADPELQEGQSITVTGWGALAWHQTPGVLTLQGADVPYVGSAKCNLPVSYDGHITANMLCAGLDLGGIDSCQGDSGGPATAVIANQRRLIGIVSWGEGCGSPKKYGVYTRVTQFRGWIRLETNGDVSW